MWRFWLLVAMIPMVAVLVIGATFFGGPAASSVGRLVFGPGPPPARPPGWRHQALPQPQPPPRLRGPSDWFPSDYTLSPATPLQEVVVARINADLATFGSTKGDVLAAKPTGALLTLGPLASAPPGVDTSDPSSVLGSDVSSLVIRPPTGLKIDVFRQAQSITVDGKAGKEAVLRVTRSDGVVFYLERVYLAGPGGLFKIDALVPQSDWDAGDGRKVEAVVQSAA